MSPGKEVFMPAPPHRRPQDHRAHARVHVQIDVTLMSDSQLYTGLSENLSEGGVFVATHVFRKMGEMLDLTLTLPGSKPIHTVGEVRWIREVTGNADAPPGIGLQFVLLTEEDAKTIRAFLRKRAPLFFEA
jgi:uncharacterized protein (TIGR02266 family)